MGQIASIAISNTAPVQTDKVVEISFEDAQKLIGLSIGQL